jgi:hypothetical protein
MITRYPNTWVPSRGLVLPRRMHGPARFQQLGGVACVSANRRRGGSSFPGEDYVVDPSAVTSTEDGTEANPYKSMSAARAAKCNKAYILPIRIRCRTSGSVSDTTRSSDELLGQEVRSSTNYLLIVADTGHRAGRSWNAAKYNLSVPFASGAGAGVAFKNSHSYCYVDGLQISVSSQAGQDASCEVVYTSEDAGNHQTCLFSNCLIKGTRDAGAGGITRGISVIYGVNMFNCIIYDMGSAAGSSPVKNHGSSTFGSCTFISHGSGAIITFDHTVDLDGNGTCILKNCYAGGATFHDYDIGSGTVTMTNCGSSDTTAVGTSPQVSKPVSTTHFNNVTAGSQDWGLPGTSALKGNGIDTSGSAAPFNFTTDIEGTTRSAPWDIGAVKA